MNERRKQEAQEHIAAIRESLNALDKLGLSISDYLEQRTLWRITGRAHEVMRDLNDLLEGDYPYGAKRPPALMREDISTRLLDASDLSGYRALQRNALAEAPDAFAQTMEQDARTPDADVAAWLDRGEAWGVFKSGVLVGKLVMDALPYTAFAHTRWLHAVYIHPDARRSGAGEVLMDAAAAHAREEGVTRLLLWVHSENGRARAFYEKIGFRETGIIPGGIRVRDHFVDDIIMWMPLG